MREVPRRRTHPEAVPPPLPGRRDPLVDLQRSVSPSTRALPSPELNFEGQSFDGAFPPDTVGDVGSAHYIQAVNSASGSKVTIYAKSSGGVVAGPFLLTSLWTAAGACADGLGDPIVLYDPLASRWLLAEFASNRVLEYDSPLSSDTTADQVFGQAENLMSTKCNIGGLVAAKTLCSPRAVAADSWGNVYIADTGNNRVLEFSSPLTTDRRADLVFGQFASFATSDCNKGGAVNRRTLCRPSGVAVDASGDVFIADSLNHRVLEYDSSLTTDVRADRVFGQGESFSSATCNNGGVSAGSLCTPRFVAIDDFANLYVADTGNHRVLEYDDPLPTPTQAVTPTPTFTSTPTPVAKAARSAVTAW